MADNDTIASIDELLPVEQESGEQRPFVVVLKEGVTLDEHLKWLLEPLGIEKQRLKRINREYVGRRIGLEFWIRGPPVMYFAYFHYTDRPPTPKLENHMWDRQIIRSAPGVARIIEHIHESAMAFFTSTRTPILREWARSGPPVPGWQVTFKDKSYTIDQHFGKIGHQLPLSAQQNRKWRLTPKEKQAGRYCTDAGVTEEQIMVVFDDPNVERVEQRGENEQSWGQVPHK